MNRELRGLRWRLTAWYVAMFGAILVAFGLVIYRVVSRQLSAGLDRGLAEVVDDIVARAARATEGTSDQVAARLAGAFADAHRGGREVYLLDAAGAPIYPDTAPLWAARAARAAAGSGAAWLTFDADEEPGFDETIDEERDWRVYARRLESGGAPTYVAVAAADPIELEDQYARLIWALGITAALALLLAGGGGYLMARRASAPAATAFEQIQRFAADAAHELRNPLATMRARAEIVLGEGADEATRERALAEIAEEGRRLSKVLDRLLILARADTERLDIASRRVNLDDVLLEAAPALQAYAARKGIEIHLEAEGDCAVAGDAVLLGELFTALVENAIKFSPQGSRVDVSTRVTPEGVSLAVEDRGPGIPPELQSHVFEPFYRADPAVRGPGGVGLGLSIARRIADAHGARISIASRAGGGTTVRVDFPRG